MALYVGTIALVFALLAGGIAVDAAYRRFARRHPDLGPFRDPEGGCGCCGSGSDRRNAAGGRCGERGCRTPGDGTR